jgi:hypothetical protein
MHALHHPVMRLMMKTHLHDAPHSILGPCEEGLPTKRLVFFQCLTLR